MPLLMESLGDKFIDIVTQRECSHHLFVGSLFISLHIYYARYCVLGDTVVIVAIPASQTLGCGWEK